jgi:hypothetical protein
LIHSSAWNCNTGTAQHGADYIIAQANSKPDNPSPADPTLSEAPFEGCDPLCAEAEAEAEGVDARVPELDPDKDDAPLEASRVTG